MSFADLLSREENHQCDIDCDRYKWHVYQVPRLMVMVGTENKFKLVSLVFQSGLKPQPFRHSKAWQYCVISSCLRYFDISTIPSHKIHDKYIAYSRLCMMTTIYQISFASPKPFYYFHLCEVFDVSRSSTRDPYRKGTQMKMTLVNETMRWNCAMTYVVRPSESFYQKQKFGLNFNRIKLCN